LLIGFRSTICEHAPVSRAQERTSAGIERPCDELERCSKALFGNYDFMAVALAIATSKSGMVNATDLSDELGVRIPRVRAQLLTLEAVRLVTPAPREGGGKRHFLRVGSPFWATCVALAELWDR
jgi:hypothetical protein